MRVLKFGGSSVSDAGNMSRVLDIVEEAAASEKVILVSSAISGCTDSLIEIGARAAAGKDYGEIVTGIRERHHRVVNRLFSGRERNAVTFDIDSILSELSCLASIITIAGVATPQQELEMQTYGELLSTRILAAKLKAEAVNAKWLDSRDIIVKDDLKRTYSNIRRAISRSRRDVFVAPGFIARESSGTVTTLGRGGSDYSAAIFAAAAGAPCVEIWTDVPGIMTANPKTVPQARTIRHLSYDAAFCMAEHGAKVLYAPTVTPAREKGIPIIVRNTFDPSFTGSVIDGDMPADICRWVGVSSLGHDDYEDIFITAEGEFQARQAQARGIEALKDAGISAVGSDSGDGFVCFTVMRSTAREACITLHTEFI